MLAFSASTISTVPVAVPGLCSPNLIFGKYNLDVHRDLFILENYGPDTSEQVFDAKKYVCQSVGLIMLI